MLEARAATLAFAGVALGATVDKRWLALPILRPLAFRTAREIDEERYALKALRGDFGPIGPGPKNPDDRASHALMAARL